LGMGSEQDARTTRISSLLTLGFKCQTAYLLSSYRSTTMGSAKTTHFFITEAFA